GNLLFTRDIGRESEWIREGLDLVLKDINRRFTAPLALPRSVPTPHNREVRSVLDRLDQLVDELIAERRGREEEYEDLLSMLMLAEDEETGEQMSDQQIHDEVLTFVVAGHETTANALAWALYLLSENPSVRKRLEAEVDEVVSGRLPTLEEMGELDYTEQVLDEVLRMYPPAWSVGRTPKEDDEVLGYHIPAGSIVTVGPYFVHHNPEVWEDPETFDPSRFGPDGQTPDHRFAHFPFGGGPRKCVGADLAVQESKLVLVAIARQFRLDLVEGHPVEPEATVTITPRHGLEMIVESRYNSRSNPQRSK
ncbi:MAG: cytochrome P450, partial [Bradymonadaceae bacterium]